MKAELEKVREEQQENKQQREVFDAAISGLLDRARERKIIRVTKDDVRLYLFETGSQLGQGNIGMLTLAVNTKLGAKEIKPKDRNSESRFFDGKCENCGEPTKFLQIDPNIKGRDQRGEEPASPRRFAGLNHLRTSSVTVSCSSPNRNKRQRTSRPCQDERPPRRRPRSNRSLESLLRVSKLTWQC